MLWEYVMINNQEGYTKSTMEKMALSWVVLSLTCILLFVDISCLWYVWPKKCM
jgi:hypothetical protein